jgi:serine/threonine protein kinase
MSSPLPTSLPSLHDDIFHNEDVLGSTPPLPFETPTANTAAFVPIEGGIPIPGFQLVRCLGKGGFGEVWQATGPGGFAIAMKFIRLAAPSGDVELQSLELMKKIRHPNLLGQFGAWERDGLLIVAMELADGNLQVRLANAVAQGLPGIPTEELLPYLADAARGIDYLNEPRPEEGQPQGIQHRDIKPSNLLLVGGCIKVGDFGLVKLLNNPVNSNTDTLTVTYAAPECLNGLASPRSDQYSLAISYCQLRSNRVPYRGTALEIMAGHLLSPPDLSMLPLAERSVVARALAKNPEERWPSCRAFVQALAAVAGENLGSVLPPPPHTSAPDTAEWVRKKLQAKPDALPKPQPPRLSRKDREERAAMQFFGLVFLVVMTCGLSLVVLQSQTLRDFLSELFSTRTEQTTPASSFGKDYPKDY